MVEFKDSCRLNRDVCEYQNIIFGDEIYNGWKTVTTETSGCLNKVKMWQNGRSLITLLLIGLEGYTKDEPKGYGMYNDIKI